MIILTLYIFALILVTSAVCLAGAEDLRRFQISNKWSGLVLGAGVIFLVTTWMVPDGGRLMPHVFNPLGHHIASCILMFLITFTLFVTRVFGAGDAKLMSSLALWVGVLNGFPLFVLYTSLCGGVLGVATLALRKLKPIKSPTSGTWIASAQAGDNRVPYGAAIAAGFLLTIAQLGYIDIMSLNKLLENGG